MDEALASWMKTLEDVFPTVTGKEKTGEAAKIEESFTIQISFTSATQAGTAGSIYPCIPGTNCEHDEQ